MLIVECTSLQLCDLENREGRKLAMTLMPTRSRGVLAITFHPDFAFAATEGDYILVDFMTADDNNFGFASNTLDLKHFNTLNANFQLLTVCSISDNLSCNCRIIRYLRLSSHALALRSRTQAARFAFQLSRESYMTLQIFKRELPQYKMPARMGLSCYSFTHINDL